MLTVLSQITLPLQGDDDYSHLDFYSIWNGRDLLHDFSVHEVQHKFLFSHASNNIHTTRAFEYTSMCAHAYVCACMCVCMWVCGRNGEGLLFCDPVTSQHRCSFVIPICLTRANSITLYEIREISFNKYFIEHEQKYYEILWSFQHD